MKRMSNSTRAFLRKLANSKDANAYMTDDTPAYVPVHQMYLAMMPMLPPQLSDQELRSAFPFAKPMRRK